MHHRDPLLKVHLILPLPCPRSVGDYHCHPVLDALVLDEADGLEHENSNHHLPLAKSSNCIRYLASPMTFEPLGEPPRDPCRT
jgi:hypothetical protein